MTLILLPNINTLSTYHHKLLKRDVSFVLQGMYRPVTSHSHRAITLDFALKPFLSQSSAYSHESLRNYLLQLLS